MPGPQFEKMPWAWLMVFGLGVMDVIIMRKTFLLVLLYRNFSEGTGGR